MEAPTPPGTHATPKKDQPEKYIRTFAGDMETVQKGGTPDLAPLPSAKDRLVAPTPLEAPAPIAPAPAAKPVEPAYTPPAPANAPLKTYATDFSDRIKATNASTATVIAAEQDVQEPVSLPERPAHPHRFYMLGGAALVLLGVVGGAIGYVRYLSSNAPVPVVPTVPAPIAADEREELSGSGESLMQAFEASAGRFIEEGAVRHLYLTDAEGSPRNVFTALPIPAPEALVRNVNTPGSMAGIIQVSGVQSPFFILSVASYSTTFSAMLSWESQMPTDLKRLFTLPSPVAEPSVLATATSTATSTPASIPAAATSTPAAPPLPAEAMFADASAGSHDIRAFRDTSGREVLVYGYWNQSTLIIARSAAAFMAIAERLASSRTRAE